MAQEISGFFVVMFFFLVSLFYLNVTAAEEVDQTTQTQCEAPTSSAFTPLLGSIHKESLCVIVK